MVPAARVVLFGFALLLGGFASRLVKRLSLAYPNTRGCWKVRLLGNKFRRKANLALGTAMTDMSPLNVSLHAGKYEIPFYPCNIGMEVDATVHVAGFEDAQIQSFVCQRDGPRDMTLSTQAIFGRSVETAGAMHVNWSLCGIDYPNETAIRVGAFHTNPGVHVAVKLYKKWNLFWKISGVETLQLTLGGVERVTCDLTGLPEFIGKPTQQWCEDIIKWLIGKIGGQLKGETGRVLNDVEVD